MSVAGIDSSQRPPRRGGLKRRLTKAWLGSGHHARRLQAAPPVQLLRPAVALWPGDPDKGNALFQGRYHFGAARIEMANQPPWRLRADDAAWMRGLHDFHWLRDFAAVGGEAAGRHARRLVRSWIESCQTYDAVIWAADVTARRLSAWLEQAAFLTATGDEALKPHFAASLGRQLAHLSISAETAAPGRAELDVAVALIAAGICLADQGAASRKGVVYLKRALDWQIGRDGGYVTRSPGDQLAVLAQLLSLTQLFESAERDEPRELTDGIERMAAALAAMRHGDGSMALFNGALEGTAEFIDSVLARAGIDGDIDLDVGAPRAGLEQLRAGADSLIMDVGEPTDAVDPRLAYEGLASFEYAVGVHRLVVNCGSGVERNSDWAVATRGAAAHSGVTVDGDGPLSYRDDGRMLRGPQRVRRRRREDGDNNTWLEVSHDGFRARHGLTHQRRLYLASAGGDLRGEDLLLVERGEAVSGHAIVARFHLHPSIQASVLQGGGAVLLKLPDGEGWRFRASGGEVTLEESVYLGRPGPVRRTSQIVLRSESGAGGAELRWAFRRT